MVPKKEYIDVLNNLKKIYETYSVCGDKLESFVGNIVILHLCTDEQDGEWELVGIGRKNKDGKFIASYYRSSRSNFKPFYQSVNQTADYIHFMSNPFDLNTDKLKQNFSNGIELPIRQHLTKQARIKQKLEGHKSKIESLLI